MKLSFVIPCYNSEKTIKKVVERIIQTVNTRPNYDYEIICVNDYSKDDTLLKLKELTENNKRIKAISLSRNFGQHGALMAGFHYVSGDVVVCLDDDGQNAPEDMFLLIDKLEEGYDLVSAKYEKDKRSFIRRIGSHFSFLMSQKLIGMPKGIELNSYYVFRGYIVNEVLKYDNSYPFVHGLILRVTRSMANVTLTRFEREEGHSGYNLKKLLALWMNGFIGFSEIPLRFVSFFGIAFAGVGFIGGIVVVIRKIIHPEIALGYSSTMAAMLFLFGLMMLFMGLLGEYVGRIYISINNAPQFVVKEKINIDEKDTDS